jgi:hypothetical protein
VESHTQLPAFWVSPHPLSIVNLLRNHKLLDSQR